MHPRETMSPASNPRRIVTLTAVLGALCAAGVLLLLPPWPQDPGYHHFADTRTLLGIPNALNVLTNLAFLIVAAIVALMSSRARPRLAPGDRLLPVRIFALGLALTSAGSAIYHAFPSDRTLVLDRAGMVVAFMALVAILIGDYAGIAVHRTLAVAELVGMGSIAVWMFANDLRLYGVVQFFPPLLLLLLPLLFRSRYTRGSLLAGVFAFYAIAKLCETYDRQIFDFLGRTISGHSLKHLAAAGAAGMIAVWLKRRELRES
jgi:hypothetical protein